jgi:hypothetical protein
MDGSPHSLSPERPAKRTSSGRNVNQRNSSNSQPLVFSPPLASSGSLSIDAETRAISFKSAKLSHAFSKLQQALIAFSEAAEGEGLSHAQTTALASNEGKCHSSFIMSHIG